MESFKNAWETQKWKTRKRKPKRSNRKQLAWNPAMSITVHNLNNPKLKDKDW